MRRLIGVLAAGTVLLGFLVSVAPARMIAAATLSSGNITVSGSKGAKLAAIMWEGAMVTQTDHGGVFNFTTTVVPQDCVGMLSDGVSTMRVAITDCIVAQRPRTTAFPTTGEATCWDSDMSVMECMAE